MSVPTYSLFVVAPLNVLFNYLFVSTDPLCMTQADEQVWGPKSIRLGFSGGALATSLSYTLNVCQLGLLSHHILIPVRILLHMGNDVRSSRSQVPIQAIPRLLQTWHSHLSRSSRYHHGISLLFPSRTKLIIGIVRMVGMGSMCIGRIDAWSGLACCSILSTFNYQYFLPSPRFARYCLGG